MTNQGFLATNPMPPIIQRETENPGRSVSSRMMEPAVMAWWDRPRAVEKNATLRVRVGLGAAHDQVTGSPEIAGGILFLHARKLGEDFFGCLSPHDSHQVSR